MLKGMLLSVEERVQDWRGTKKFTSLGRVRNEDSATQLTGKTGNSWQDTVAKIAGQCGAFGRKD